VLITDQDATRQGKIVAGESIAFLATQQLHANLITPGDTHHMTVIFFFFFISTSYDSNKVGVAETSYWVFDFVTF
jgi:hypothetical protein